MLIFILLILLIWGLGIGDWAQSPIPNPQSPFTCTFHIQFKVI